MKGGHYMGIACRFERGEFVFQEFYSAISRVYEVVLVLEDWGMKIWYQMIHKKRENPLLLFRFYDKMAHDAFLFSFEFVSQRGWVMQKKFQEEQRFSNQKQLFEEVGGLVRKVLVQEDGLFRREKICCVCVRRPEGWQKRWYCGRECWQQ